jgi:hypothetical protein
LAKAFTSTPEPVPKEVIKLAAADFADAFPVGVLLDAVVLADEAVAVVDVVAETILYTKLNYLR